MRQTQPSRLSQIRSRRVIRCLPFASVSLILCAFAVADIGETSESLQRRLGAPSREIKAPNGDSRLFFKDGERLIVAEVVTGTVEAEVHFGVDLKQAEKLLEKYPTKWTRKDFSGNTNWNSAELKLVAGFVAKFPGPSGKDEAALGELLKPFAERGFFTVGRLRTPPTKSN